MSDMEKATKDEPTVACESCQREIGSCRVCNQDRCAIRCATAVLSSLWASRSISPIPTEADDACFFGLSPVRGDDL